MKDYDYDFDSEYDDLMAKIIALTKLAKLLWDLNGNVKLLQAECLGRHS